MTLTSFFDQPDHPECEFCVPLGSIKPHEELDKNFLSHLTEITLHGNFDFLKVNETKSQILDSSIPISADASSMHKRRLTWVIFVWRKKR